MPGPLWLLLEARTDMQPLLFPHSPFLPTLQALKAENERLQRELAAAQQHQKQQMAPSVSRKAMDEEVSRYRELLSADFKVSGC